MIKDALAGWKAFLASPGAPATAMSAMEVEGYVTGLAVLPDLITLDMWLPGLWGETDPVFESDDEADAAFGSVMGHRDAVIRMIDSKGARWKPLYFNADGGVDVGQCSLWVRGFLMALILAPDGWAVLAEDMRTQHLFDPFAAFFEFEEDRDVPPPDDIDDICRSAAEEIPHVLPALRAFARIRIEDNADMARPSPKIGRNAPCPCGSGRKYKKCCGRG